ncbi:MAG: TetR/AcrR family transcriptional regulator [Gammaproteobacteria bacterium]|nr:TetR/AcrR family transcriptional regulator [Gammaproteobacteria bacterium]MCF6361998.1 TetR/AcrR family transcriptional regulator [Gammaproteobacteria bacterium]
MNARTSCTKSDIHEQILAAAFDRFVRFGYNKTTMAEIAGDCGMSAANIYRYFDNKLDIGAQLASQCLAQRITLQSEIVARKQIAASERLHELVFATLRYTYDQWLEAPLANELVTVICGNCMDVVETHKQEERDMIHELLNAGNTSGEFRVADPQDTAAALQTAMTLFSTPLLMPAYSREIFEEKAAALVRLLLNGLLNPQRQSAKI